MLRYACLSVCLSVCIFIRLPLEYLKKRIYIFGKLVHIRPLVLYGSLASRFVLLTHNEILHCYSCISLHCFRGMLYTTEFAGARVRTIARYWIDHERISLYSLSLHLSSPLTGSTEKQRWTKTNKYRLGLMKNTRSIWKMLGPFATASRRTPHYHSPGVAGVASHAALMPMSTTTTTTTTTTTRDRGDRYGPIEWAQLRRDVT